MEPNFLKGTKIYVRLVKPDGTIKIFKMPIKNKKEFYDWYDKTTENLFKKT